MDINNLKHVVGKAEEDKPACICIFGPIDDECSRNFKDEFEWLDKCVKPSEIDILINSEGGSCLRGMNIYSTIQSASCKTKCINEGLAASMASVIWAAGDSSYMRDYAILMIHNPFSADDNSSENVDSINAFKSQIETIYSKRFGLSAKCIRDIMDGEEGKDGTFFNAKQAVEAGIIAPENVISTCKQARDKAKCAIKAKNDVKNVREQMQTIYSEFDEKKLFKKDESIHIQNSINKNTNKMNDNAEFSELLATLVGLPKDSTSAQISAKVTELSGLTKELNSVKSALQEKEEAYNTLNITNQGNEAKVTNLSKELGDVKAKLAEYQTKEAEAKTASINTMVDDAVKNGKITDESKAQWVQMAESNFDMVKATLDSIPARDKITDEIKNDGENLKDAKDAAKGAEAIMNEKVSQVIGDKFSFKKLD